MSEFKVERMKTRYIQNKSDKPDFICGFLPKPFESKGVAGNTIEWEDWNEAFRLVGMDPYHAHHGGKGFSEKIVKALEPPVFEIGCGYGGLLALADYPITGIDISSYCVEKAKEITQGKPNVKVIKGDFLKYNNENGEKFKTIISLDVFPLLPKKEALMKCKEILEENGKVIFTDYFAPKELEYLFTPFEAIPSSSEEYKQAIKEAGFSVSKMEYLNDQLIEEAKEIIGKMKEEKVKEWIIDKWGEEYYRFSVEINQEWLEKLAQKEISYQLITLKPE